MKVNTTRSSNIAYQVYSVNPALTASSRNIWTVSHLSASRARLSGLELERVAVIRIIGANQAGVATLSERYAKQTELARLQTEAALTNRSTRDTSKVQLDESTARFDSAQRLLEDFNRKAQVGLLTEDANALLMPRAESSIALLVAEVGGQVARARGAQPCLEKYSRRSMAMRVRKLPRPVDR